MFLANQDLSNSGYLATGATRDPRLHPDRYFRVVQPEQASLTALEQGVVAVSLFDHPSSIRPPSLTARFLGWIFGSSPPNQLADDRLEALRRYCILLREARGVPGDDENARIRAAGFSDTALKEARKLIALGRHR